MKIDKSRASHWFYLGVFTVNACLALLLRWLLRGVHRDQVILYGHKLNGNLKAIQDRARAGGGPPMYFLTMDPAYYRVLRQQGAPVLLGLNPLHMFRLVRACALVSDHGLHSLEIFLRWSDLPFIDVWHGIPFKGFDDDDFRVQHRYDEVWVTSRRLQQMYTERFGFRPEAVQVTGYARTDLLVNRDRDPAQVRSKLGIPSDGRPVILFAPTWQQDDQQRSIFPFGIGADEFLRRLDAFCREQDVHCVLRQHLNTKSAPSDCGRVHQRPYEQYPDAEEVLLASDILVCDWSSIAFDFLLLDRPTIFLDVPPPFDKGFSLDASYRFGDVVGSLDAMFAALAGCLRSPADYLARHGDAHRAVRRELYDELADGHAAERCCARLRARCRP